MLTFAATLACIDLVECGNWGMQFISHVSLTAIPAIDSGFKPPRKKPSTATCLHRELANIHDLVRAFRLCHQVVEMRGAAELATHRHINFTDHPSTRPGAKTLPNTRAPQKDCYLARQAALLNESSSPNKVNRCDLGDVKWQRRVMIGTIPFPSPRL